MTCLAELSVENLAVVERVRLTLAGGLVALTGETGVGKSIMVDAVKLLTGAKAGTEQIRAGAERAVVEGVFRGIPAALRARLQDAGVLDPDDDSADLIVRRVVARSGGGGAYVNDRRVGLPLLAELGDDLVDVLGQHAQRSLLSEAAHGALLDAYAGLHGPVAAYRETYAELRAVLEELAAAQAGRDQAAARAAFLRFALDEIEGVAPDPEGDDALPDDLNRLAHATRLRDDSAAAYQALYGADGAVLERLAKVFDQVADLAATDPALADTRRLLDDGRTLLEEAADGLRHYRDHTRPDPERQAEVEQRLAAIEGLKRKYGRTLDEILATAQGYRDELAGLADPEGRSAGLAARRDRLLADLADRAERLHAARRHAGERLAGAVHASLARLAMPHARLTVAASPCRDGIRHGDHVLGPDGHARMHFLLAANPGEGAKPLNRVASGGELSRIMLALKLALIDADPVPCLIFDEVDAGIGGAVAEQVGRMLKALAAGHQVFCVTHLPQIASLAHQHLLVAKDTDGQRTRTRVTALDAEARVGEVARMLGGVAVTETTLAHAREMLAAG
ncbi:MAG: DNA repair protein RecN [Nitrospirae bacterium]|nr:DNA repair protein RecN [Nitrospirota bacterium]